MLAQRCQFEPVSITATLAGIRKVPKEWFPTLKGADVLALACGGGQQCPVFAVHGAEVTVIDISNSQLAKENMFYSGKDMISILSEQICQNLFRLQIILLI